MSDVAKINAELEQLHQRLKEQEQEIQKHKEALTENDRRPLVVMSSRRLERFRDKPTKSSDQLSIQEWIIDARAQAASRQLSAEQFGAFLLDHLSGKARQEILGRGEEVKKKPEEIIKILTHVFGDGHTLPVLQQKLYACQQGSEDLVTYSLNMVELYDRIVQLDESFKACRESTLKARFAEGVSDEGLRRELRRLNVEASSLTFFELRDRGKHWIGSATSAAINQ